MKAKYNKTKKKNNEVVESVEDDRELEWDTDTTKIIIPFRERKQWHIQVVGDSYTKNPLLESIIVHYLYQRSTVRCR